MVKKNTDAYFKILERFDPKDQNSSLILREILNEYPFFQSASAYYLKSLMVQGKESFDRLLPRTAILSFNRSVLRKWIYNKDENFIDEKLDKAEKHSFLDWFDNISENQVSLDEKIGLIDKFIKNSPRIRINEEQRDSVKITVNSNLKDDLITETLAKIYIKQEKYNKAIKAYEILSLKYPKKSILFANQIKRIKKLKNNSNK